MPRTAGPLQVAIAGAGLMGRWHAHYAQLKGARISAVVDPALPQRQEFVRRFPAAAEFDDLADCLRDATPHVVHICTPAATHTRLAEIALQAGAHVIVEKPATLSAEQAAWLLPLAEAQGRLLTAVHQCPFQRGVVRCLERRAVWGEPVRLDYHAHSAGAERIEFAHPRDWQHEFLPHPYSLFRHFLGRRVDALIWQPVMSSANELSLAAAAGDLLCRIDISLLGRPPSHGMHVTGTRGSADIDLFHGICTFDTAAATRRGKILRPMLLGGKLAAGALLNLAGRRFRREPAYPGLSELIGQTYAAIRNGGASPVSAEEILGSARMIEQLARLGESMDA